MFELFNTAPADFEKELAKAAPGFSLIFRRNHMMKQ
jgi:hypothetical protein